MDFTTIGGIVLGVGALIAGIMIEGGALGSYVGISAAVIILGGTIGATAASFPLRALMNVPRLLIIAITETSYNIPAIIQMLVAFSEKARREGILALEAEVENVKDDFLKKGLQLVIDGTEPDLVRDIMETRMSFIEERHHEGAGVFEAAGGYAPTMGIIGTVLGLINVLSNIKDASKLAGAIALAFIATLYGIMSANLIWLPIAAKLKNKHKTERLMREIVLEGILSLQAGDNPRMVEHKLKAFLSESYATQHMPASR